MRFTTAAFALAAFASSALAHVEMVDPPPFRSKANKNVDPANVDFDMNSPLNPSNFPCKGYQQDFNTPAGDSTADWAAGTPQTVTLSGSATHNGGSCQFSLSYDEGKTFHVIKSIEGNCAGGPNDNKFTLNVPADAKSGKAIFAWTWFNHTGNREMYMNCAAVTIKGSGTSTLADRPDIFVANVGKECKTQDETDLEFPNPGPDVDKTSDKLAPPICNGNASPPPEASTDTDSTAPTSSPVPDSTDPTNSTVPDATEPTKSTDPDLADPTESCDHTHTEPTEPTAVPSGTSPAQVSSTTTPSVDTSPSYVVKAGDTCTVIAAKQGVSLDTIFSLNPVVNKECTNLKPDQVLTLRRRSRIMRDLY